MTHTPAPWTIQDTCREYNGELMIVAMQAGDNGVHICEVTTSTKRNKHNITPEQDANAALIAAAPELLEALRELVEEATAVWDYGEDYPQIEKAIAAIAKATGE